MDYQQILNDMIEAVVLANKKIMEIYNGQYKINIKEDESPVTDADLNSNKIIKEYLCKRYPDIYYFSEEEKDDKKRLEASSLFIVDPLDGTTDFISRDDSFAVNLALVVNKEVVACVIGLPAKEQYAYALKGQGSYLADYHNNIKRLHVSNRTSNLIMVCSKTHLRDDEIAVYENNKDLISKTVQMGASTKAIALASGEVDVSVRFSPNTKEWDTCAPDLLVREAGGIFVDNNKNEFVYNREDPRNLNGYSMFNRKENMKLLK